MEEKKQYQRKYGKRGGKGKLRGIRREKKGREKLEEGREKRKKGDWEQNQFFLAMPKSLKTGLKSASNIEVWGGDQG